MEYVQSSKFNLDFQYLKQVNLAIQQNKIPLILQFTLENTQNEPIENISISIESNGDLFSSIDLEIPILQPGIPIKVDLPDIFLNLEYLLSLTEAENTNFRLEILIDDRRWIRRDYPLEILPYNQWSGINNYPELISAFVTPNHPFVIQLQRRASQIIESWTQNSALNGYQEKNYNRVKQQIGAVYQAISELNLSYSNPPSSFEIQGQRIRTADQILEHKITTCLDSSILFCSVLEAIGLHPIMIFTKGHAFLGVWLTENIFPDLYYDDVSILKNSISNGINSLLLLESTSVNGGKQISFDDSINLAIENLQN
jgi:hypothetical protein